MIALHNNIKSVVQLDAPYMSAYDQQDWYQVSRRTTAAAFCRMQLESSARKVKACQGCPRQQAVQPPHLFHWRWGLHISL